MSMPAVDAGGSSERRVFPIIGHMEALLVIAFIAVLGLLSQAVGADSRTYDTSRAV
jgi:hypothetical protein